MILRDYHIRSLARKLFRRALRAEPKSYEDLKGNQHVFVFGVWGRTSTTALQRILNSTRQLCIWGEPGEYLVDNLVDAYLQITARMEAHTSRVFMEMLPDSFRRNDFGGQVAMAQSDWGESLRKLEQAFVDLFLPLIPIKRLGFKEIRIRSRKTLYGLRRMFPNCQFVHTFRDPIMQWSSVQTMTEWKESRSIELFIDRVEQLAAWYLEFDGVFVEDIQIKSKRDLDRLVQFLGVPGYDPALIDDGVSASRCKPRVSGDDRRRIEERLGDVYARMQRRSKDFFEAIR